MSHRRALAQAEPRLTSDLWPRLPQISEALNLVRELLQQLTNQRASMEEDIQSNFEDLHKQLDVRKSVLLMELEVTYGLKQKVLQAQVEHLVQAEGDMVSSCSRGEEALEGEACVASALLERQLQEELLQAARRPASCQPEENHQLELLMETDALRKSIHNLGTILTTRYAAQPRPQAPPGLSPAHKRLQLPSREPALCSSSSVQWRARAKPWGRGLRSAWSDTPPRSPW